LGEGIVRPLSGRNAEFSGIHARWQANQLATRASTNV
jgi:hypothetical protein